MYLSSWMACCVVQVQPRKHVLEHARHTAPIGQHELERAGQDSYLP